jgi:hypothetical protein
MFAFLSLVIFSYVIVLKLIVELNIVAESTFELSGLGVAKDSPDQYHGTEIFSSVR